MDEPQTTFRFTPQLIGGHVHVRVFVAPKPAATFASVGTLTMSDDDWNGLRHLLAKGASLEMTQDGVVTATPIGAVEIGFEACWLDNGAGAHCRKPKHHEDQCAFF